MSAANNKIAAVIVTYNRLPMLKKCVDALLRQNKGQFDILLIDNASTDGTGDYGAAAAAGSERIFYHNTGANLGGAGGFSYGIRTGVTEGYDYLWLMDDDIGIEPAVWYMGRSSRPGVSWAMTSDNAESFTAMI